VSRLLALALVFGGACAQNLAIFFVDLLAHNVLLAAGMFLLSNFDLLSIRVSEIYPTSYWVA